MTKYRIDKELEYRNIKIIQHVQKIFSVLNYFSYKNIRKKIVNNETFLRLNKYWSQDTQSLNIFEIENQDIEYFFQFLSFVENIENRYKNFKVNQSKTEVENINNKYRDHFLDLIVEIKKNIFQIENLYIRKKILSLVDLTFHPIPLPNTNMHRNNTIIKIYDILRDNKYLSVRRNLEELFSKYNSYYLEFQNDLNILAFSNKNPFAGYKEIIKMEDRINKIQPKHTNESIIPPNLKIINDRKEYFKILNKIKSLPLFYLEEISNFNNKK